MLTAWGSGYVCSVVMESGGGGRCHGNSFCEVQESVFSLAVKDETITNYEGTHYILPEYNEDLTEREVHVAMNCQSNPMLVI